ncbi:hypothetical protein DCAR_0209185 [Daucus carota subsp. sativus]|uniref:FAD-binding PCMH-type domain-containing protein n=2 Tax=Daucus carota subsp. sativus TaxID=79200 RepID=A0AAF0WHU7_DAUCS|nr:hypothetical protein DCAR_0209185 [Daucus carota subsp. sativus]
MKTCISSMLSLAYFLFFIFPNKASSYSNFTECLVAEHFRDVTTYDVVYTPVNTSFNSLLQSRIQNLRFLSASTPKPLAIVTPKDESHLQIGYSCAYEFSVQIRIRGGGHDSEGLSYTSAVPFVIFDFISAGSMLMLKMALPGIAQKNRTIGFPGSTWPSVGMGGFLSGGGYGSLMRKYGLGADNVVDIQFMNKNGNIYIGRSSIGEDLFWAIRGGTASSYGVVLSWKIKLVPRTLEQNATQLVHKYQTFAAKTDRNLYIRAKITPVNLTPEVRNKTVLVSFQSLFLGRANRLLKIMQKGFPELGLTKEDCHEMSWIKSTLWFAGDVGFPKGESLNLLMNRDLAPKLYFKAKTDYVEEPISVKGLEGMWKRLMQQEEGAAELLMIPYGGKMDKFTESAIPFPHRAGNLYMLYQGVYWNENTTVSIQKKSLKWLRSLSKYLTPHVSKNPRRSYVNFNDLDLGVSNKSYEEASSWGTRYFKNNFKRLVQVKNDIDPQDIFHHEQSIPLFPSIS